MNFLNILHKCFDKILQHVLCTLHKKAQHTLVYCTLRNLHAEQFYWLENIALKTPFAVQFKEHFTIWVLASLSLRAPWDWGNLICKWNLNIGLRRRAECLHTKQPLEIFLHIYLSVSSFLLLLPIFISPPAKKKNKDNTMSRRYAQSLQNPLQWMARSPCLWLLSPISQKHI